MYTNIKTGIALLTGIIGASTSAWAALEWQDISGNITGSVGSYGIGAKIGDQLYVATQDGLFRSTDGVDWESLGQFGFYNTWLDGLILENGSTLLYASRSADVAVVSPLGEMQVETPGAAFFGNLRAAAEGNGRIVLGGGYTFGGADPAWWVSTDGGATYTSYQGESRIGDVSIEESLKGLVYYGDQFIAVGYPGEVWTSQTGESWTTHALPTVKVGNEDRALTLFDVKEVDGILYASGSYTTIFKSTDGINWEEVYAGSSYFDLERLHIDGSNWHAVSAKGGHIYSTNGGDSWAYASASNTNLLNILGGGDYKFAGRYFAPANGPISFFTKVEFEELGSGAKALVYGDGKWIATNSAGSFFLGSAPASIFDEATTVDGFYYEHPWLGWFVFGSRGWNYHYNLGWIYSEAQSGDDVWIFTPALGWIHTTSDVWPHFVHAESGDWGVYDGSGEAFYNLTAGEWQSAETFGDEPWIVSADWLIGKTLTINDTMGTHTVEIVSADSVNATFNVAGKTLIFSTADATTWFDSSALAAMPEGRRFTFDIADATAPGIGDRVFPLVFTFENNTGGTSLMSYTYLSGLFPVSRTNIEGTFTVSE